MSAADGAAGAALVAAWFWVEVSCAVANAEPALNTSNNANPTLALRINPALTDGVGHAINRQHIGRDAIVYQVGLGKSDNIPEGLYHDRFQLFVDHRFLPEIALAVLHPLKIGGGHAA